MIEVEIIDKSDSKFLTNLYSAGKDYWNDFLEDTQYLSTRFGIDPWFAKKLNEAGFIQHLELSVIGEETEFLQGYINAYKYPFTLFGLVGIIKAVFSQNAVVEAICEAGKLTINVSNANQGFIYGLLTEDEEALLTEKTEEWIIGEILEITGEASAESFFKKFIMAGVEFTLNFI